MSLKNEGDIWQEKNLRFISEHIPNTQSNTQQPSQLSQNIIVEAGQEQVQFQSRNTVTVNNKRERQRRYREQNREKLKKREAERRRRLQNLRGTGRQPASSNVNIRDTNVIDRSKDEDVGDLFSIMPTLPPDLGTISPISGSFEPSSSSLTADRSNVMLHEEIDLKVEPASEPEDEPVANLTKSVTPKQYEIEIVPKADSVPKANTKDSVSEIVPFTLFVQSKMMKYSPKTLSAVEKAICDILFKADEEYFDNQPGSGPSSQF